MRCDWSSDVCSRSEEHTSELQSHSHLVCRLLLEKTDKEARGFVDGEAADAGAQRAERACAPVPPALALPRAAHASNRAPSSLSFVFFLSVAAPLNYPPFPHPGSFLA